MGSYLFKIKKNHVGINDGRFLSEGNTFDFFHDILHSFFERLTLDIENCVDVLVLPVEDPTDLERVLVILSKIGILRCCFENIVVSSAVPYSVDTDKVNFGAPVIRQQKNLAVFEVQERRSSMQDSAMAVSSWKIGAIARDTSCSSFLFWERTDVGAEKVTED